MTISFGFFTDSGLTAPLVGSIAACDQPGRRRH